MVAFSFATANQGAVQPGLATAHQGDVQRGSATAKIGIAKVAKRFGQQRHSFVTMSRG